MKQNRTRRQMIVRLKKNFTQLPAFLKRQRPKKQEEETEEVRREQTLLAKERNKIRKTIY